MRDALPLASYRPGGARGGGVARYILGGAPLALRGIGSPMFDAAAERVGRLLNIESGESTPRLQSFCGDPLRLTPLAGRLSLRAGPLTPALLLALIHPGA